MQSHSVIDQFLTSYLQRQDFYSKVSELCREQCRETLQQNGIRHIATSRAKGMERLREKLHQRAVNGHSYTNDLDILNDIVDLAGVRIALYFPGDTADAERLLKEQFEVEWVRSFPTDAARRGADIYTYRFRGYSARHIEVRLRSDNLKPDLVHYSDARIEIQVASVFMHAWAEVEHDLVYKPLSGQLSVGEYTLLDEVNGLAFAGELALEQLQRTMQERIANGNRPFGNHYDLASYIHSAVSQSSNEPRMGRADKLLRFLRKTNLDRPSYLDSFLDQLRQRGSDGRSLVEKLVAQIIESDRSQSLLKQNLWKEISSEDALKNPYEPEPADESGFDHDDERRLRRRWRMFEDTARRITQARPIDSATRRGWLERKMLEQQLKLDPETAGNVVQAQQAYTRVLTDNWRGTAEELETHASNLEKAIKLLFQQFPECVDEGRSNS